MTPMEWDGFLRKLGRNLPGMEPSTTPPPCLGLNFLLLFAPVEIVFVVSVKSFMLTTPLLITVTPPRPKSTSGIELPSTISVRLLDTPPLTVKSKKIRACSPERSGVTNVSLPLCGMPSILGPLGQLMDLAKVLAMPTVELLSFLMTEIKSLISPICILLALPQPGLKECLVPLSRIFLGPLSGREPFVIPLEPKDFGEDIPVPSSIAKSLDLASGMPMMKTTTAMLFFVESGLVL